MKSLLFWGYEVLSSLIPFTVIFMILQRYHQKKGEFAPGKSQAAVLLFAFYVIAVFHFTSTGTLYDILLYRLEMRPDYLNLIPFSNGIDIVPCFLNVLLFVPFGILVPFIWKKKEHFVSILGNGFAFSLLIELSQLLNNRRTDIDDLILNTLGAVIGFAFYKGFRKYAKDTSGAYSFPDIELPVYLTVMFLGRFLLFNELGFARLLYGF